MRYTSPCIASGGATTRAMYREYMRRIAVRIPRGGKARFIRFLSFRVQDSFEQKQTAGSKHQIVGDKHHDPEACARLTGQDGRGGLHHGENRRDGIWKQ